MNREPFEFLQRVVEHLGNQMDAEKHAHWGTYKAWDICRNARNIFEARQRQKDWIKREDDAEAELYRLIDHQCAKFNPSIKSAVA